MKRRKRNTYRNVVSKPPEEWYFVIIMKEYYGTLG
jgi:hypothetical protein